MKLIFPYLALLTSSSAAHAKCKKHIALLSAKEVAKEIGQSEMWVLSNYKINLWSKTSKNGKGSVVGRLISGSHALIIDENSRDYKIQSPLDKSIGWISKIQVKGTLLQDTKTREKCKK